MKASLKLIGHWEKTQDFLNKALKADWMKVLEECGAEGVAALEAATPKDTGLTASSWRYEIQRGENTVSIFWTNDNRTSQGDMIAILLQYGHGTGTGGYVRGRDYINPAIQPVFDRISDIVWKVVTQS